MNEHVNYKKLSRAEKLTKWFNMYRRCYDSKWQNQYGKHYKKHTISDEWLNDREKFYAWLDEKNYDVPGEKVDLDHNIKNPQNTVYSSEQCILAPHRINVFYENLNLGKQITKKKDDTYTITVHTGYDVIKLDGIKGWNRAVNLFCLIKMTLLDKLAEQYKPYIPNELYEIMKNTNIFRINRNKHRDE